MSSSLRTLLLLALAGCSSVAGRTPEDERAVLEVVQAFFDTMEARDVGAAEELLVPEGVFVSLRHVDGVPTLRHFSNRDYLSDLAMETEHLFEALDGEPDVLIAGDLAVVLARYTFDVDGRRSHTGVDAFNLLRTVDGWRITGGAYTVEPGGSPSAGATSATAAATPPVPAGDGLGLAPTAPDGPAPDLPPRARDRRGDEHLLAGRFDEALRDFDAYIAAEPGADPHHWRRGIALYYAGRFAEGAAQFERHRAVNPDDVENAAWHFLCVVRRSGVDAARAALLPVGPDPRTPMGVIHDLLAGRATPGDVLTAARASAQADALFFAHLYLGLYHEVLGDDVVAREHLGRAAGEHGRAHYMGRIAAMHFARLPD